MVESTKWIATIPTPSLANAGKIDIADDLLAPYSDLMVYFLSDIDLRFVRDNELLSFTNAKSYQTKEDYARLFDSCKKRYATQLEKGQTPKQSLEEQLKAIETCAVQTPLSARYVQTCYTKASLKKIWTNLNKCLQASSRLLEKNKNNSVGTTLPFFDEIIC